MKKEKSYKFKESAMKVRKSKFSDKKYSTPIWTKKEHPRSQKLN